VVLPYLSPFGLYKYVHFCYVESYFRIVSNLIDISLSYSQFSVVSVASASISGPYFLSDTFSDFRLSNKNLICSV
jgi:hypothetical protein